MYKTEIDKLQWNDVRKDKKPIGHFTLLARGYLSYSPVICKYDDVADQFIAVYGGHAVDIDKWIYLSEVFSAIDDNTIEKYKKDYQCG